MIRTIPTEDQVTVTATGDLVHQCPVVDEVDHGRVTITWNTNDATLELHGLAEYLRGFKDARLSHEEITDQIRRDLSQITGINLVEVETTWHTAGLEVTCTTPPSG